MSASSISDGGVGDLGRLHELHDLRGRAGLGFGAKLVEFAPDTIASERLLGGPLSQAP